MENHGVGDDRGVRLKKKWTQRKQEERGIHMGGDFEEVECYWGCSVVSEKPPFNII